MNWRWRWAQHHLFALWRDSELRVLALALICAVAASSSVQLFSDRVARAMALQSGETLGADMIISSRLPMQPELQAQLDKLDLQQSHSVHLPSVIWHDDNSHLAGLKAVADNYPLKGQLRSAPTPGENETIHSNGPAAGLAWVDAQLWSALALQAGDSLEIGAKTLQLERLLTYEPDRGSGFADIAPRVMINLKDLPATELLQPGSRAEYRLLLSGSEVALDQVQKLQLPAESKLITPADARPEIRSALERAGAFLALAGITASLLGAVAVALCAHQYGQKIRADVALLRCLGASRHDILSAVLGGLLAMAVLAGGIGAALAWLVQFGLQDLAALMQMPDLPAPRGWAVAQAWLMALILLAGFAMPALLSATSTPPIDVLRGETSAARSGLASYALSLVGLIALLALQTPNMKMLFGVLIGQALTAALLAGLSYIALRALQPLRHGSLHGWRLGLGNLLRRRQLSIAQSMALGLGLLALLLLTVVRQDLLQGWQNKLPPETPNQFLINIQPDQIQPLQDFLAQRGIPAQRIWPMARARLVGINGKSVNADDFDDPQTQRWIKRDFNLSWAEKLGADNKIVDGQWWGEEARGQAWISADDYARERLNIGIGDRISLDFAGQVVEFTIHNFREVDWESFQPNFFLLTPPGVLDDQPATWLTSFYLPPQQRAQMRELNQAFPSITVLDLDAMMDQVRAIMQRIISALKLVFLFTIAAGLIVLLAAMEAGRQERAREIALMRTLGASKATIRTALLSEFAALGALSGLVAAVCAQAVGWLLASQIFDIPYQLRWDSLLLSALAGALLVCAMAWLGLRGLLQTSPDKILRD